MIRTAMLVAWATVVQAQQRQQGFDLNTVASLDASSFSTEPRTTAWDVSDFVFPTSVAEVQFFEQDWVFAVNEAGQQNVDPTSTGRFFAGTTTESTDELYLASNDQGDLAGFIRSDVYDYVISSTDDPDKVQVTELLKSDYPPFADALLADEPWWLSMRSFARGLLSLPGNFFYAPQFLQSTADDVQEAVLPNQERQLQTISNPTVYILFTEAASNAECGSSSNLQLCMANYAQLLVDTLNTGLTTSLVQMSFSVARVDIVPASAYSDGGTSGAQLNALAGGDAFATYRQRRVTEGYDFLSLVVENMSGACGAGFVSTNGRTAYQVSRRLCGAALVFNHELGHNLGLQHNREELQGNPTGINYGYLDAVNKFATIMSYNCPAGDCPMRNLYSNPNVLVSTVNGNVPGGASNANSAQFLQDRRLSYALYDQDATADPISVGGAAACLSGRTLVQTKDKGTLRMDELQVGSSILTQDGNYSLVYSFGDFSRTETTTLLQLRVERLKDPVEISADHMLYATKANDDEVLLLPASDVQVGDSLVQSDGARVTIQSITLIQSRGFYHPLTVAGNMVINDGVVVSNYVSRECVPQWISPTVLAWLQHGGHAPVRWYCTMQNGCADEGRTEATGFSSSVQFWYRIEQWALSLPWLVQWMLALSFAPFLASVALVGFLTSGSSGVVLHSLTQQNGSSTMMWMILLGNLAFATTRQMLPTLLRRWSIRRTSTNPIKSR